MPGRASLEVGVDTDDTDPVVIAVRQGRMEQTLAQLVEQARIREERTDRQIAKLFSLVNHQGQQIDRLLVMGKTLLWVRGALWGITQFVVPLALKALSG